MPISQGVFKTTRIARQASKGTLATAGGASQVVRREQSIFELAKETYTTESEITSTQQVTSSRHGVRLVNGKITGILSPLTYSDPLSVVMRRDFAAVTSITGASITVAGTGPTYTLTRAAGSYLTDGIKIGMGVRLTAGTFNVANLNKNLLVTAVTATVLTVIPMNGIALFAEGPIASATLAVPGKVTFVPTTGHTNIYHTVEEWMPDVPFSERNIDCKFIQANISLPGSGNAKIDFTANGLNQTTSASAYFTAPTAETTSQSLVGASGLLFFGGTQQSVVTDLSINLDGKGSPADGVLGTDIRPDIFTGKVMVSGSFTAYFDSATLANAFVNETSSSIVSAVTAGSAANADFMTFTMSDVRINSNTPDDTETGNKRTYNYVAVLNATGGAALATQLTSLQVQDSLA
jgi:hypothetical protein